ncbi:hypothetical protein ILUMI_21915 [Ignelater luminosus]|uniref:Uncharacterized protein n=1 Tax=Ignelater luminosus TaxID=2038154 RepID=A0A8K0G3E7_IGNLU|nr:hypothetical protein ILUMI_21915 [Ignelater luminosus]
MLLVFGYCQRNGRKCVTEHTRRFPTRRVQNHQIFAAVERRLCETGHFAPVTADCGSERMIRTFVVEEEILERVAKDTKHQTLNFSSMSIKNCRP